MVKKQAELPDIRIKAFVSNNPVAIKVKILEEFIGDGFIDTHLKSAFTSSAPLEYSHAERKFSKDLDNGLQTSKAYIKNKQVVKRIYTNLKSQACEKCKELMVEDTFCRIYFGNEKTSALMEKPIEFYVYLVLLSHATCKSDS